MSPPSYYKIFTAKAPVNIAVIKYWGKSNETFKVPINDSLSGTLNLAEMCATTSVAISDKFVADELWLNGKKQNLSGDSHAKILLDEIRGLSELEPKVLEYKVHIVSYNNFPTAAGLASSAAGYACLAYVLGQAYGVGDLTQLSMLARRGSGSACRSLFGGFVRWDRGHDHETSKARQVVDHTHWPEMRVVICVISDHKKDVSSSDGMRKSVQTSELLKFRANEVVPKRIEAITNAIIQKDFDEFATITMRDSNQFHAVCLDTFPPLFYLNDTSRQVMKICSIINSHYGQNKVAYTFDAGPNACIYLLDDFVSTFIAIMKRFFPPLGSGGDAQELEVKGQAYIEPAQDYLEPICNKLISCGVQCQPSSLDYLINTSIGEGPMLVDEHLSDDHLKP